MPAIDYPNDYYNDAEYYNDAYGSCNSSDENYIDVDAQVKVIFQITQERFFYLLKKMNFMLILLLKGDSGEKESEVHLHIEDNHRQ